MDRNNWLTAKNFRDMGMDWAEPVYEHIMHKLGGEIPVTTPEDTSGEQDLAKALVSKEEFTRYFESIHPVARLSFALVMMQEKRDSLDSLAEKLRNEIEKD